MCWSAGRCSGPRGDGAVPRRQSRRGRVDHPRNGWLSPLADARCFQVALDGWNGPAVSRSRSGALALMERPASALAPQGRHVLVVGRSGGHEPSPAHAVGRAQTRLETGRPIICRMPTGARPPAVDLRDAHCTVTWTSTTAIKGLIAGIPGFHWSELALSRAVEVRARRRASDLPGSRADIRTPAGASGTLPRSPPRALRRLLALPHDSTPVRSRSPGDPVGLHPMGGCATWRSACRETTRSVGGLGCPEGGPGTAAAQRPVRVAIRSRIMPAMWPASSAGRRRRARSCR